MFENQNEDLFDLQVDHEAASSLLDTAKWTRFIAIVLFVIFGFFVFALMIGFAAMQNELAKIVGDANINAGLLIAILLPVIAFVFVLAYLLYRFGTLSKQAIYSRDQRLLDKSVKALKNFFLLCGVASLLGLLVSVIGLFTGIGA